MRAPTIVDVPEGTPALPSHQHDRLVVRGAREHNLRDVSVDLPRDSLIVFTGLSGSGKSSLAFDTIFAEGQRRYVESLSAYARQFLGQMDKPDVDFIEGLSPAVSIDQKSTNRNPRSTVGTITEVYDYLRLLFARAGRPHCPVCGEPVTRQTPQQIVDRLLELPERTRFQVLAPVVQARKGEYVDLFAELQTKGFSRARVDGEVISLTEPPKLEKQKKHTIEVVIDRLVAKGDDAGAKRRLTDSVETALGLTGGILIVEFVDLDAKDPDRERRFSEKMACPNNHPLAIDEIEPRSFSFNSPFGACPKCTGLGTELEVDPELLIPDEDLSIRDGAIAPWAQGSGSADYFLRVIDRAGRGPEVLPRQAVALPARSGPVRRCCSVRTTRSTSSTATATAATGPTRPGSRASCPFVKRRHSETDSDWSRERYEGYMREVPCPECQGPRLKPESLAVLLGGRSISAVCALPIADCAKFLQEVDFTTRERQIAERVIKEIEARLGFLLDVGLDYLSLDRAAGTLSGGEAQRIRLATQIGSGLVGVLYVLDEPSIGLHQRDNHRLIETLTRLRDLGNTLIVVEHDEDTIATADWVVDIGPGAGEHGGHVVHSGTVADLLTHPDSLTGEYLSGRKEIPTPELRRPPGRAARSRSSARASTTCTTSTSASRSAASWPSPACPAPASPRWSTTSSTPCSPTSSTAPARCRAGTRRVTGLEHLDKVVHVDQGPIGRTPAQQPGDLHRCLRPHAHAVRRDDRGQDPRLPCRAVLLQRQGRPLRRLLRRRHDQDRDELPAGRLRPVRGLPRRALQPRDARGALQGQDDRRRPRHADRGGGRVLRRRAGDRPAPEDARRRRSRLRPARPAGADAVRRRGAAGQAGHRAAEAVDRPDDLRPRRADDRPALRGHPQAARRAAGAGRQGQHGDRHRAQPRRHQERRLDHRHGPRGRQRRRPGDRRGHARAGGHRGREPHRPVPRADPRAQRAHAGTADRGQPDAGPGRRGGRRVGHGLGAGQEVAGQGGGQDAGDEGVRQGGRGDHRGQEDDGTGLDDQGGGTAEAAAKSPRRAS